jgi:hypothetical protein
VLFWKTPFIIQKTEPVIGWMMQLKVSVSTWGSEKSNCKPRCRVLILHCFAILIPVKAYWFLDRSDKCFFHLLVPGLIPVPLLERKSEFQNVTHLADARKRPSSHLQSMGYKAKRFHQKSIHLLMFFFTVINQKQK